MRGAVIPTSVHKGFLRACTLGSVAYSSTLRINRLPENGTGQGKIEMTWKN